MQQVAEPNGAADPATPGPVGLRRPEARPGSAGHVLDLIRRTGGLTRAEILEETGLARSTVAARLAALQSAGLVAAGGTTAVGRGRPPSQFHFREDSGALLLADAGATGVRVALTDLAGRVRLESRHDLEIRIGPQPWLRRVGELFAGLLERDGARPGFVRGIGLAVPGPVDFASATVVNPPIMTGWDRYPVREWFAATYDCPVILENDANAMALGEYHAEHAGRSSMVMLKIATGIGAGIIAGGRLYRGEDGAAGDIGHIQVSGPDGPHAAPLCRCGNLGCVEAYAGGWALLRDLREQGRDVSRVSDVARLLRSGDPAAVALARQAGRTLGVALADAVSLLNPGLVVIGGELGSAADTMVAGIREMVYARSLPLATRRLDIVPAALGEMSGVMGLAAALTDHIFDPARVDAALA